MDSIHADQPVAQRAAAVDNFRAGRTWVLIATDLLGALCLPMHNHHLAQPGRGVDVLGINTVVNYDMPSSRTDYIHRIGRTGRGGRRGTAITLFVEQDAPKLRSIATLIRESGSEVRTCVCVLTHKHTVYPGLRGRSVAVTAPTKCATSAPRRVAVRAWWACCVKNLGTQVPAWLFALPKASKRRKKKARVDLVGEE